MRKICIIELTFIQEAEAELDEEIDVLMSSDIVSAQMSTKPINFQRAFTGWIFKREKSVSTIETLSYFRTDKFWMEIDFG
jgi:hypothetical protein